MTGDFAWYELHTPQPTEAAAFYHAVLGWRGEPVEAGLRFVVGNQAVAGAVPLAERARLAGAPPHWLGHLGVVDLDAAVNAATSLGATSLGPRASSPFVGAYQRLRDPQGAVFSLCPRHDWPPGAAAWHELATTDLEAAWAFYRSLVGWRESGRTDLGAPIGPYLRFGASDDELGGMSAAATLPGVTTHWLYYFDVEEVDGAAARTSAEGGRVYRPPMQVPGGDRLAVCEDPQGAAFALRQRIRRP